MFAWGINNSGELSLGKNGEADFDMSGKVQCMNCPEKVVGLRGDNWPTMIKSGISHSVAVVKEGVLSCGSTVLASTMVDVIDMQERVKLSENKFVPVNGLKSLQAKQLECGDYHTACVASDGHLYAWGGSLNQKLSRADKDG